MSSNSNLGTSVPNDEKEHYSKQIEAYLKQKEFVEAEKVLDTTGQESDLGSDWNLLKIRALEGMNRYEEAKQYYKKAGIDAIDRYFGEIAMSLLKSKEYGDVEAIVDRVFDNFSTSDKFSINRWRLLKGIILEETGRSESAINYYREIRTGKLTRNSAWLNFAKDTMNRGFEPERSIAYLDHIDTQHQYLKALLGELPLGSNIWYYKGLIYERNNQQELAELCYSKISLTPIFLNGYLAGIPIGILCLLVPFINILEPTGFENALALLGGNFALFVGVAVLLNNDYIGMINKRQAASRVQVRLSAGNLTAEVGSDSALTQKSAAIVDSHEKISITASNSDSPADQCWLCGRPAALRRSAPLKKQTNPKGNTYESTVVMIPYCQDCDSAAKNVESRDKLWVPILLPIAATPVIIIIVQWFKGFPLQGFLGFVKVGSPIEALCAGLLFVFPAFALGITIARLLHKRIARNSFDLVRGIPYRQVNQHPQIALLLALGWSLGEASSRESNNPTK